MSDATADIDRIWALIAEIPVAMVVTRQGRHMRARPMAVRPARDEGAIYFLTDADAAKADEIRRDETICLALADNRSQKYVSIAGYAEIVDDRDRVREIWSIYDKAFWPDKNDPRIRILRVTPESAEFWEGAGAVVTAVKLAAAMASGERINFLDRTKRLNFRQADNRARALRRTGVFPRRPAPRKGAGLDFLSASPFRRETFAGSSWISLDFLGFLRPK